jgi:hypothetical protein
MGRFAEEAPIGAIAACLKQDKRSPVRGFVAATANRASPAISPQVLVIQRSPEHVR